MIKALFKKQMLEVFSWIYRDRRTGKNRSKQGTLLFVLLFLFLFYSFSMLFYMVADTLCVPLTAVNLRWLFFALMGLLSVVFGVFGSVFSTYSSLYQAKDNDFLFSMPIPSSRILIVRLSGVYTMGLLYELLVMLPTLIVYFRDTSVSPTGIVFSLLVLLLLSFFILTLSCVLGWAVALIGSRLKRKNTVTVLLSLAFIAGYYLLYAKAYTMLQAILANPERVSNSIRKGLYPLYHMGLAAEGSIPSMLFFTAIITILFGIVYLVLSRSFLKLITTNRGTAKNKYKEKTVRASSADGALFRKEWRRFLGSPVYMLNCGICLLFMIVAAIALLVKKDLLQPFLSEGFIKDAAPLLATAAICLLASACDITAPSVSLEGKNLWLVRVLPVTSRQILKAKLKLHLVLTLPPVLFLAICAEISIGCSAVLAILIPVITVLFVFLTALIGLALNLKFPNLNWTNETVPVKQSTSVLLTMLSGWAIVLVCGGVYTALTAFVTPSVFLLCVALLLSIGAAILLHWIKSKGERLLDTLS